MLCVIIAGSPFEDIDCIKSFVSEEDFVICADKGYLYAQKAKVKPDLIVGDFDSYSGELPKDCEIISLNSHKDDTDTMHAIDVAFERGFKDIALLCAIGGRTDHSFANISALMYIHKKGGKGVILNSNQYIQFLPEGNYSFDNLKNITFSVFPFGCSYVNVSYTGTEYSMINDVLRAEIPMGISNIFTDDKATIKIKDGSAIIIINFSENSYLKFLDF